MKRRSKKWVGEEGMVGMDCVFGVKGHIWGLHWKAVVERI
jgi:hypothetical protein